MAKRVSSPELIGRTEELDALGDALGRVGSGEFAAVLVGGEAGVGKTRLVNEFEQRALADGARVLVGDCVELAEGELPFAPLTGALRPVARDLTGIELEMLPGREELARLLPELGGTASNLISRDSALDEPLAQSRLFEVLLALLTRLGEDSPLVLAIEDLHWADRSTRDFLSFLIRNARDARLLLVCTYRGDELHRRHPLRPFLAELERRTAVERIDLRPLTRGELGGLLAAILEHPPTDSLVGELFARSDGNPFFAEELLAASAVGRELPDSLRDALMVRVEAVSETTRAVLRVVATAGRRVSHSLLDEVAGIGEEELDAALREAVEANILIQAAEGFSFRHALVREAVATDVLPGERTALHAALASALTEEAQAAGAAGGTAPAEIAYHWWEARRLPEALTASLAAGDAAEEVFAFAEAHRHLEHALEIWDQVPDAEERAGSDLAGVLMRAADNANLVLDPGRAVALARRAIELVDEGSDPVRAALLRERLGRYLWVGGRADESLRAYHDAVDLMPPEPATAELARVLSAHGQILMLRGRPRESRERCEQAIEVARAAGARAEEAHAMNTLGVDISSLGDHRRGIECLRQAKAIAEELGWVDEIGRGYVNLSEEVDWGGDPATAAELALEGAAMMRRLGARSYVVFLEAEAAQRLTRIGRLADAERALQRIRETGPHGVGDTMACTSAAEHARLIGRLDDAAAAVARSLAALGETRDSMYFGPCSAAEVEVALAGGDPARAVAVLEQSLATIAGEYAFTVARLYARGIRAYAELAESSAKDPSELNRTEDAARSAVERFDAILAPEHYPEGSPPAIALGYRRTVDAELSRIGGRPEADLWLEAAEGWEPLGEVLELAYARWRAAEAMLIAGERRQEAADLLTTAAGALREAGATAPLADIEALARRARVTLDAASAPAEPTERRDDGFGLTPREIEVLQLLAEGCTNREIGERLFMSQKTASVHVSRILTKLKARGRVEAATKAQRLGLISEARS